MNRPYGMGLMAGIGTGLVFASGTLLGLYAADRGLEGVTAFLSWLGLFTTGFGLILALAPWLFAEPKADATPPAPPALPTYLPPAAAPMVLRRIRINDRTGTREVDMPERRPARWVAWQACIEAALEWARERGGITSGLMVGQSAMFRDRGDWVVVTGVMATAGLLEKANGRAAQLTGDPAALLARVREGRCEWPTDRQPPAYAPAPVSVGAELLEAN